MSGTAWLPFSNKSTQKVWENKRETKSQSQKGAEIIIKKRRSRGGGFKSCQGELGEMFDDVCKG